MACRCVVLRPASKVLPVLYHNVASGSKYHRLAWVRSADDNNHQRELVSDCTSLCNVCVGLRVYVDGSGNKGVGGNMYFHTSCILVAILLQNCHT